MPWNPPLERMTTCRRCRGSRATAPIRLSRSSNRRRRNDAVRHHFLQVPLDVLAPEPEDPVGGCAAGDEFVPQGAQRHRMGARLDDGENLIASHPVAQSSKCGSDRGGVVGEIIVDDRVADLGQYLQAALDAGEAVQRVDGHHWGHPGMAGGGQGAQGIGYVVIAEQLPGHPAHGLAAQNHVECAAVRGGVSCAPHFSVVVFRRLGRRGFAEAGNGCPTPHAENFIDCPVPARRNDQPDAGYRTHQVMEPASVWPEDPRRCRHGRTPGC